MPRSLIRATILSLGLVAAGTAFDVAAAPRVDSHAELWAYLSASGTLKGPFLFYAEIQPRLDLKTDVHLERMVLRGAGGYQVKPWMSVWMGYVFSSLVKPTYRPEHRIYQQLLLTPEPWGRFRFTSRTRIEERFISGAEPASLRFRTLVRGGFRLTDSGLKAVTYDEFFVNLNSVRSGPQAGVNQNRFFAGFNHPIGEIVSLEAGYMNEYIWRSGNPNRVNHIALIWCSLVFP